LKYTYHIHIFLTHIKRLETLLNIKSMDNVLCDHLIKIYDNYIHSKNISEVKQKIIDNIVEYAKVQDMVYINYIFNIAIENKLDNIIHKLKYFVKIEEFMIYVNMKKDILYEIKSNKICDYLQSSLLYR